MGKLSVPPSLDFFRNASFGGAVKKSEGLFTSFQSRVDVCQSLSSLSFSL